MNNKEIKKNIVYIFFLKGLSIIVNFFTIPKYIQYLNDDLYGIWIVILNVLSWITFFDIGLGNGLKNYLTLSLVNKNKKESDQYISTAYFCTIGLGVGLLIILLIIFSLINWEKAFNIKTLNNTFLFFIIGINLLFTIINFILVLVNQIFHSLQKSFMIDFKQLLFQGLNYISIYILIKLKLKSDLLHVSLIYGILNVILNLFFTIYIFKKEKFEISIKNYSLKKFKLIKNVGIKFFIIQIMALILFSTDNILIVQLFGPREVTNYNIIFKLFGIITIGHGIIITPFWTAFTKAYGEKNINWIKKTIFQLQLLEIFIILGGIILVFISPKLIEIWIGKKINVSLNLRIMLFLYVVFSTYSNIFSYLFNGLGIFNFTLVIGIIQGVLNIPLSIFLAKNMNLGISGIVLGTNIVLFIFAVTAPIYYRKIIKKLINKEES